MSKVQIPDALFFSYRKNYMLLCGFVILYLLLISTSATAQQYTMADTVVVEKLLAQSKDSNAVNPGKSLQLAEKAMLVSKQISYTRGYAAGVEARGVSLTYMGKPDEAISLFREALDICTKQNYKNQIPNLHALLGSAYDDKGEFNKAIEEYDITMKEYTMPADSSELAHLFCNMGILMNHMHEFGKSSEYLLKAVKILAAQHNPLKVGMLYANIGGNYINEKKYSEAFRYLFMARHVSDSLHTRENMPVTLMNIALCYDVTDKKDSAVYYYIQSLALFKEMKDVQNQALLLSNIGSVYDDMNKFAAAEKYYKESLKMAQQASNLSVINITYGALSNMYFKKHDYLNAFRYKDSCAKINDSLYNQNRAEALAELATKYETREIAQKNDVLQKENDLQKLRLQRKNILVYSLLGIALLAIIIGFLLVRQNTLRTVQKHMELEQKQLLAQINPHFIFNCLNSIQQFVVQNDTINANRYLADFALLMRQTLDNSKDGIISLRREMEYLDNYLSFEHMRFEDKFTYTIEADPALDTGNIEIPSMIIQPFVENAVRHGLCNLEDRKGLLKISFYKKDGVLYCNVDDNGIGMEQAQKLKEQTFIKYQSLGMELTRQRLALVSKLHSEDYKISIVNKLGAANVSEGTTIIIKFPLEA